MSSLFTVRGNGNESYPPFEVLDTKGESKNTPHGVFLQGGVINSFNEMSTDYTCMDVETSPLQALSNQQFPVPINPIGGSFNIELPIQQDQLVNPSSIFIILHIGVNKSTKNNASVPVVLTDGLIPVSGFYPIRTVNAKINQFYINGDIQARSNDISLFRNVDILSEYDTNYSFGNVKQIYEKYNNFHGIHQTLDESKTGLFNAYTIGTEKADLGKAKAVKSGGTPEACTTFKKAFFYFQQRNIQKMCNGGFLVKLELDIGFLNKTRLTPFVIESAIIELTFHKPLAILAREKSCTEKAIDTAHFVIKNAYIQHQSVLPSEKVWKNLVSLSDISTDLKKDEKVLPSWFVKQKVCFDPVVIPSGVSSSLNHVRGREIPERLLLFFRRKSNIGTNSSNDLYLDFPEITKITISSSSLSSHFINRTQTSPFTSKITGINDVCYRGEVTHFERFFHSLLPRRSNKF